VFLVELDVFLGSRGKPLTDDEITDLIEAVVDELDQLPVQPSVGTQRLDEGIEMTIGVFVDTDDAFEALRLGTANIGAGLKKTIGAAAAGDVIAGRHGMRSSVRTLQPA